MSDQRHAFVADVPDLAGFAWPDTGLEDTPAEIAAPTSRIQVAKQGAFKHPRYGRFKVTNATFDSFIQNLAAGVPTDQIAGDFDHEPDLGGSTAACGWLKPGALEADADGRLWATVEWTWEGAYAIREQRYRYISPTWSLAFIDDEGVEHGPTILGFALTNRPFFTRMAAVSLSQSFSTAFAGMPDQTTEDDEPDEAPDSRPRMADLAQFAEIFGLPEDADETTVLAHARDAQTALTAASPAPEEPEAEVEAEVELPPVEETPPASRYEHEARLATSLGSLAAGLR